MKVLSTFAAYVDEQRTLWRELLAAELPQARMRPVEGTYLAWIDLRAIGHRKPARVCLERGLVRVSPGHEFHPGAPGHVRLNFATSPKRFTEIVHRMAAALFS